MNAGSLIEPFVVLTPGILTGVLNCVARTE